MGVVDLLCLTQRVSGIQGKWESGNRKWERELAKIIDIQLILHQQGSQNCISLATSMPS